MIEFYRFRIFTAEPSPHSDVFRVSQEGIVRITGGDNEKVVLKIHHRHHLTAFDVVEIDLETARAYYTFSVDPHDPDQQIVVAKPFYMPKR